jgi:hypothetical protein
MIAQGEFANLPSHKENTVPSPQSGANGNVPSEIRGNPYPENLQVPVLHGLAPYGSRGKGWTSTTFSRN